VRSATELVAAMKKAAVDAGSFGFHTSLVGKDGPIADVDGEVSSKAPAMASIRRNDAEGFHSWLLVGGKGYLQNDEIADGYWQAATPREVDGLVAEYSTTGLFRALDTAAKKVAFVGRDELVGTKTFKYEFVLDSAKALAAEGQAPSKDMPATVVYTVWVDDKDRPRKASFSLADVEVTSEYGWGAALDLVAPPHDHVIPAPRRTRVAGG
jgi:hypothetical protein